MFYLSTRGHPDRRHFCEILLEGLAPDGGLYMPDSYPQMDTDALQNLRHLYQSKGYAALAFTILSLYIDDIPPEDLMVICQKTYTSKVFGDDRIVPVPAHSSSRTLGWPKRAPNSISRRFSWHTLPIL